MKIKKMSRMHTTGFPLKFRYFAVLNPTRIAVWLVLMKVSRSHSSLDRPVNRGHFKGMKTPLGIPDSLFRRAKATAARRGQSLASFINLALETKLRQIAGQGGERPWMRHAGVLKASVADLEQLDKRVEEGCGQVNLEDWK